MKVISFGRGSCLLRVNDFAEPVLCFSSTVSGISFRKLSITLENGVERALDGFWVRVLGHDFFFWFDFILINIIAYLSYA